ncbi:serine/threonine-protein phosphatase 6 regulatory ankyrin repeat subunit B [Pelomyxa schiedti]|nr:serine/threonine-protein phosphatase 6 regulatory ankyrin repeat subunit B [Pelomyxa schiedti]
MEWPGGCNNKTPGRGTQRRGTSASDTAAAASSTSDADVDASNAEESAEGSEAPVDKVKTTSKLHLAAVTGDVDSLEKMLRGKDVVDSCDEFSHTPLHYSAIFGIVESMKCLVAAKANVNRTAPQEVTPLHFASRNGHFQCVDLLIKSGAKVNVKDSESWTPLHYACFWGHLKVCRVLLENRASLDEKTEQGQTPLHLACNKGYITIASELITAGASIECVNSEGASPLETIPLAEMRMPADRPSSTASMRALLNNGLYSDITLVSAGIEKRGHKCVLAARSPYLLAWFNKNPGATSFQFPDLKENIFSAFVEWIYTDENLVALLSHSDRSETSASSDVGSQMFRDVSQLLFTAQTYEVKELKDLCIAYLCRNLSQSNIVWLWNQVKASYNDYPELITQSVVFFLKHAGSVGLSFIQQLPPSVLASVILDLPLKPPPEKSGN